MVFAHRYPTPPPRRMAALWTGLVITLDAVLVAGLIMRDFSMFDSMLGTWLPFALIFLGAWPGGVLGHRLGRRWHGVDPGSLRPVHGPQR